MMCARIIFTLALLQCLGLFSKGEKLVYESDFDRGVGRQSWSDTRSFQTPKEGERLLGPFYSEEPTTLSVGKLPKHNLVRVRFRVYMLDTVDGSHPNGQDAWSVGVVGGPCLLHTTFDNKWDQKKWRVVVGEPKRAQAYPDEVGVARHPSRLGADAIHAMGLDAEVNRHPVDLAIRYDIDLVFPHDADSIRLRFGGAFVIDGSESWALDEVKVSALEAPAADADKLLEHWQVMHADDPEKANGAMWSVLGYGQGGIDFVLARIGEGERKRDELAKQREEDLAKDYAAVVTGLDSEKFIERVQATQALLKLGEGIRPLVERQLRSAVEPQTRVLLKSILKKLEKAAVAGDEMDLKVLARARVKHLLRVAGTPAAQKTLREMIETDAKRRKAAEVIVLTAEEAKLKGLKWSINLDKKRGCWTHWDSAKHALYWFPELELGEYEVVVKFAVGDGVGGDRFEVLVAGQALTGKVPELKAGAEDPFADISVGKVLISNPGKEVIYLRPDVIKGAWLMELKSVKLVPVK